MELGRYHYNEVEAKSSKVGFEPNYKILDFMHEYDLISLVTARVEGELVGYIANVISESIFNKSIEARELGIYVHPNYRGSRLFYKMIKASQEDLKSRGVDVHYIMFKEGYDSGLAERLGYEKTETVYQKILEG
jgi:GNAT superfamily N-acetyltransferase